MKLIRRVDSLCISAVILCLMLNLAAGLVVEEGVYDETFARRAALFAQATHCSVARLDSWTCGSACLKTGDVREVTALYNSTNDVQGYSAYDTETNLIILAFRPTVSDQNWLLDFNFQPVPYSLCAGCKIHKGFQNAWGDLRGVLLESTRELIERHPDAKIAVIGHSLGGALAVVASAEVSLKLKRVSFVYTFGQPRVGNPQFADFYDAAIDNIYRLIHWNDLIPHLPLQSLGFRHSRREIWYNIPQTSYVDCTASDEDPNCSDSLKVYSMEEHDDYFTNEIGRC